MNTAQVGHIKLAAFNARALSDVAESVQQLETEGAAELVLDLRDNRGGLVQEGIEIANLFLDGARPPTAHCLCFCLRQRCSCASGAIMSRVLAVLRALHGSEWCESRFECYCPIQMRAVPLDINITLACRQDPAAEELVSRWLLTLAQARREKPPWRWECYKEGCDLKWEDTLRKWAGRAQGTPRWW